MRCVESQQIFSAYPFFSVKISQKTHVSWKPVCSILETPSAFFSNPTFVIMQKSARSYIEQYLCHSRKITVFPRKLGSLGSKVALPETVRYWNQPLQFFSNTTFVVMQKSTRTYIEQYLCHSCKNTA